MRGYWNRVARRAWRRSLEIVRLESSERIFVFLIGILVPAIAVWLWIGDTSGASVRLLASLGAGAVAVFLVFVWSLLKLPAIMEAEAEVERQRIAKLVETQEERKRLRESLGQFMSQGTALRIRCSNQTEPAPEDEANRWYGDLISFLETNLGPDYAARIQDNASVPLGMSSLQELYGLIDSGLRAKLYHLDRFLQELR